MKRSNTYAMVLLALAALIVGLLPLVSISFARSIHSALDQVMIGVAAKLLILLVGGAIGLWLLYKRKFLVILALGVAGAGLALMYVTQRFQRTYPDNRLTQRSAWADVGTLLFGKDILLGEFQPTTPLKVPNRVVMRARYPAIDIHFHLGSLPPGMGVDSLIKAMDSTGIAKVVNLDGVTGDVAKYMSTAVAKYPDRIIQFAIPDLWRVNDSGFAETQTKWIELAARLGARGLKVHKFFGLNWLDRETRRLIAVDDPRFDPIWRKAAELHFPIVWHALQPAPFFDPVSGTNERFEELRSIADASLHVPGGPRRADVMKQRENVLARHPNTVFIGAHVGMNGDDLAYVASMLDRYPNYYVDIASMVHELGRQPYTARRFFIRYQDRILFGTDGGVHMSSKEWPAQRYFRSYITFLEAENEYDEYPLWGINKQGRWRVYGLALPDSVLEKVYRRNAEKLIPSDSVVLGALRRIDERRGR
ncbi:MAG: amidohydrolase family protein [Gemmatimonadaceae bacterium]